MSEANKYRKKPVVIQAIEVCPTNLDEVRDFLGGEERRNIDFGINYANHTVTINTLEGTMKASTGDWIIRGVKGEYYPCKPEIFQATYEPAVSELEERRAVIEAEPEVEALQDGGTCCICDNPITGYDSYGISDKQLHRYHWHCVRREAATVSSPTSEAETAKLREELAAWREVGRLYDTPTPVALARLIEAGEREIDAASAQKAGQL